MLNVSSRFRLLLNLYCNLLQRSIWAYCNLFNSLWPELSLSPLDLQGAKPFFYELFHSRYEPSPREISRLLLLRIRQFSWNNLRALAKHLKLMSMHFNTRNNDQLLLQHPPVGTNSYGRRAFSYTAPTVWNKVPDYICSAPSVMSFRRDH